MVYPRQFLFLGIQKTALLFCFALFFCISLFAENLPAYLRTKAADLAHPASLNELIETAGDRKLVLLGESTHGTSEYYTWRAEISKRLITEKGFSFIAVEGDWASLYRLNAYVKGFPGSGNSAREVMRTFNRWPVWMWANTETEELIEWLRIHNRKLPGNKKVGFYGMDVYGQWDALYELLEYTERSLPDLYPDIKSRLECFLRFGTDEWQYARAVNAGSVSCQQGLKEVVEYLANLSEGFKAENKTEFFRAKQNALVVKNAEDFFRLAIRGGPSSWNSRVNHMNNTVNRLLNYYGPKAKGIVWAHNTHIGDSRATPMHQQGMHNIGQLTRSDHGAENVLLVGFSTYIGRVMAGLQWGALPKVMEIPTAKSGSAEYKFNRLNKSKFVILFDENDRNHPILKNPIPHRAMGVVYNPLNERANYVPTLLAERYDAIIFIRQTKALTPIR